jgi:alanyl-tRNA synthetase
VRYGRLLGHQGAFLARLSAAVIDRFGDHYPYLRDKRPVIERLISQEEARFSETLAAGTHLLNNELDRLSGGEERTLPGATAFRLYNTYGFPLELTQEVAAGRGFEVDGPGFTRALEEDQDRARRGARFGTATAVDLPALDVRFEGYQRLNVPDARVLYLRQGSERVAAAEAHPGAGEEDEVWAVLDRTPFYAERGGQVGDSGVLVGAHGRLRVRTTQVPTGETVVHIGRIEDGYLAEGDVVSAEVDAPPRQATMRHHTATHLLHAALRAELGAHVHQTGSLVAPDRLRFDFAHGEPLTPAQRHAVQARVNDAIRRNLDVHTDVLPVDEALRSGAMALFDEKYGDSVRVLTIGDVSKELCGGTHVQRTGEIGSFVIVGESSIGAGTRRVESLAGAPAEGYATRQLETLDAVSRTLEVAPPEVPGRVQRIIGELGDLRRRLEAAERRAAQQGLAATLARAEDVAAPGGSFKLLAAEVDVSSAQTMERLREAADWLRDKLGGPSVLLLAAAPDSGPLLLATVSKELTGRGLHGGRLLGEVAGAVGGRGGGRPELAQGGGGDPAKLEAGLQRGRRAALSQAGVPDSADQAPDQTPDQVPDQVAADGRAGGG